MTTQRVHPAIGNPADSQNAIALFNKSCTYFDAHYVELAASYPDEFVGVFDGQVRAHAASLSEMLARLDALDIPRATTYTEFLAVRPRAAIL